MKITAFEDSSTVQIQSSESPPSRASAETLEPFRLNLQDHQICFVVPVGARIDAVSLDLPGGALILGSLRGKLHCATGSAVIAKGGEFQGVLVANDVLVEGRVTSPMDASGKLLAGSVSQLTARGYRNEAGEVAGGILGVATGAYLCAKMHAVAYQILRGADLSRSTLETISVKT